MFKTVSFSVLGRGKSLMHNFMSNIIEKVQQKLIINRINKNRQGQDLVMPSNCIWVGKVIKFEQYTYFIAL